MAGGNDFPTKETSAPVDESIDGTCVGGGLSPEELSAIGGFLLLSGLETSPRGRVRWVERTPEAILISPLPSEERSVRSGTASIVWPVSCFRGRSR